MPPSPKALRALNLIAGLLLAAAAGMVFMYAPREVVMGEVQRVFYFHVAAGWVGMVAFLVTAVAGGIYLAKADPRWDRVAVSSAELGLVFVLINIISGSIWARPIWNTWWTWDPRLVTATVMELVYLAYMVLRQGIDDPERRARFASVYGIAGVISVPITLISIRLFRTIHPVIIGSGDPSAESFDMTPAMVRTLMFSLLAFSVLYADLLWHRVRLAALAERVEQLRARVQAAR